MVEGVAGRVTAGRKVPEGGRRMVWTEFGGEVGWVGGRRGGAEGRLPGELVQRRSRVSVEEWFEGIMMEMVAEELAGQGKKAKERG